ncbi:MAG: glycerol-3-phosphate dehydrogenase subunit GlpB [Bacteroidales bacterium]|nr:glycerol-3-phosphate dehydrogenase subunit GlpB [Bacteroidales bacterium]
MSFDTIIIGGGLSGLTAGIALAKAGQQVALAAAGQSTLNYFSGSFDLLGYNAEGKVVSCPLDEINNLPASHPYAKIGADAVAHFAAEAQTILTEAGIDFKGDASGNHSRITPLGVLRPAWLSLDDCLTADTDFQIPNFNFQVLNIEGFLDFPVEFIAHGLEQMGAQATTHIVTLKIMQANRKSPYETRATSIARLMDNDEILRDFAAEVKSIITNLQPHTSNHHPSAIVLPAVFGLNGIEPLRKLREMMGVPVFVIATLPPSLLGMRVQNLLRKRFTELGGKIFHESKVTSGFISAGEVISIASGYSETVNADNYILATGSFQSHGLVADYRKVSEPLFNLDIDAAPSRTGWTKTDIFDSQPFMGFGVSTDSNLHPFKGGAPVRNLYAVGSVLSGHNALAQADGTGVSLITALAAATSIAG